MNGVDKVQLSTKNILHDVIDAIALRTLMCLFRRFTDLLVNTLTAVSAVRSCIC